MKPGYALLIIGAAFVACASIDGPDFHADMSVRPKVDTVILTAKEARLAEFYAKEGSNEPIILAQATAKTKRPRLMAAVAVVESNGNVHAIGRAGEVTAWQIREELHGPAGVTVDDHAKSAERILEELIQESNGKLKEAVRKYNGSGPDAVKYSKRVMAKLQEVPL